MEPISRCAGVCSSVVLEVEILWRVHLRLQLINEQPVQSVGLMP